MVGENATIWPAVLGTRVAILAGYSSGARLSGHMRGEVPLAYCWYLSRLAKEWARWVEQGKYPSWVAGTPRVWATFEDVSQSRSGLMSRQRRNDE